MRAGSPGLVPGPPVASPASSRPVLDDVRPVLDEAMAAGPTAVQRFAS